MAVVVGEGDDVVENDFVSLGQHPGDGQIFGDVLNQRIHFFEIYFHRVIFLEFVQHLIYREGDVVALLDEASHRGQKLVFVHFVLVLEVVFECLGNLKIGFVDFLCVISNVTDELFQVDFVFDEL